MNPRKGIAAVELAVTLPVLVLFVFSLLQLTNTIFLKQKLTAACYIGMQQLAQLDAKESAITSSLQGLLSSRGVSNALVEILPAGTLDTAPTGREFSIRITAPMTSNLGGPRFIPINGNVVTEQWIYR